MTYTVARGSCTSLSTASHAPQACDLSGTTANSTTLVAARGEARSRSDGGAYRPYYLGTAQALPRLEASLPQGSTWLCDLTQDLISFRQRVVLLSVPKTRKNTLHMI